MIDASSGAATIVGGGGGEGEGVVSSSGSAIMAVDGVGSGGVVVGPLIMLARLSSNHGVNSAYCFCSCWVG